MKAQVILTLLITIDEDDLELDKDGEISKEQFLKQCRKKIGNLEEVKNLDFNDINIEIIDT